MPKPPRRPRTGNPHGPGGPGKPRGPRGHGFSEGESWEPETESHSIGDSTIIKPGQFFSISFTGGLYRFRSVLKDGKVVIEVFNPSVPGNRRSGKISKFRSVVWEAKAILDSEELHGRIKSNELLRLVTLIAQKKITDSTGALRDFDRQIVELVEEIKKRKKP